ncbi:dimethyl sulfoxide reductase anchor subunit [Candidatus Halobeggiatoa sp. HSG11]|nr:dimethyl sulfoxide reductase anchor subunit [Candidatus Halobeggiatoa sp. HSG11]
MHPAISVVLLTTLIGVGQGLFLALYTGQIYSMLNLLPVQNSQNFYALGNLLALTFLAMGLFASFFHLGRPLRAWRSASQWRTSWLSREVIILPTVMFFVALYGVIHYFGWSEKQLFVINQMQPINLSLFVGAIATLVTFLLFVSTSMIYASIRFLPEWYNPLTVINYILLGGASGFTLATAFSIYVGADVGSFYALWAIILTTAAFITRSISLLRNNNLKPKSNLRSAIGVRHTIIKQKTQGFMGGSFNTREFFHNKSLDTLKIIKVMFLILIFLVPIILLFLISFGLEYLAVVAFVSQYLGLTLERWYFFTEGTHPQNLYYQTVA